MHADMMRQIRASEERKRKAEEEAARKEREVCLRGAIALGQQLSSGPETGVPGQVDDTKMCCAGKCGGG